MLIRRPTILAIAGIVLFASPRVPAQDVQDGTSPPVAIVHAASSSASAGTGILYGNFFFFTDGPTACGTNENLRDPFYDAPENIQLSPVRRGRRLVCDDATDNVMGSTGFRPNFNRNRSIEYRVLNSSEAEELWFIYASVEVRNTSDGPVEGRLGYSIDGGSTYTEILSFPITNTWVRADLGEYVFPTSLDSSEIIFGIQAKGGDSGGVLEIRDLTFGLFYQPVVPTLRVADHESPAMQIDAAGARLASVSEIDGADEVPSTHAMEAAYPNPFNPQAQFSLSVSQTQIVNVSVYDVLGRKVLNLFDGELEAGSVQPLTLDGHELSTGVLFVRATGETFSASQTVTLLR